MSALTTPLSLRYWWNLPFSAAILKSCERQMVRSSKSVHPRDAHKLPKPNCRSRFRRCFSPVLVAHVLDGSMYVAIEQPAAEMIPSSPADNSSIPACPKCGKTAHDFAGGAHGLRSHIAQCRTRSAASLPRTQPRSKRAKKKGIIGQLMACHTARVERQGVCWT